MPVDPISFVFVHGAWHGAATWAKIVPFLEADGHNCFTLDLPGAGSLAQMPAAFLRRPLDPAAFATEPSPNGSTTQDMRTAAVIELVRTAARQSSTGKVVLTGHSMGGVTVSAVAEAVPELLQSTVYLTAFLLPPGMPAIAMIQHELMESALVPSLLAADPMAVGALRIDTMSEDEAYGSRLRSAFYGDVPEEEFFSFRSTLHCDEPAQVVVQPSPVTRERFGMLPRHYIRCSQDRAITPEGQDFMVSAMDAAMGSKTTVHQMASSHSPFLSRPRELTSLLASLVDQSSTA